MTMRRKGIEGVEVKYPNLEILKIVVARAFRWIVTSKNQENFDGLHEVLNMQWNW
jgi:hypothetical protein